MIPSFKLIVPSRIVTRITDASAASLRQRGIAAVITDLDNTLVPWKSREISEDVFDWLAALKRENIKIVIASNTMHPKRLKEIAERMDIPYILGVRKPWPAGYRRSMQLLGSTPETTAMIGDQVFTDIMGANALGLHTILLRPQLSTHEFIWTIFVRQIERLAIGYLTAQGRWPTPDAPAVPAHAVAASVGTEKSGGDAPAR
ncbi:MAG: YqeG family HAD IIIA-type phosphatase [Capsulimonadaceae bacterium]|nr:YqeG family HAD IIIA-type phosphatase [Capsulimonadaceae bacterium]